ncbi:MAG: phosphatidylinositol-specific phospholipase C domain-containing protein [Endozoicomonas sp.]
MTRLFHGHKENTRIMNCTMIGSHDSATHSLRGPGKSWAITQSRGIGDQLNAGARYFDIRITRDRKGEFIVHHGPIHGCSSKSEVITPLRQFLQEHPNEMVLIKLQFSGMSKAQVKEYMDTEFQELSNNFALPNHDQEGKRVLPGTITFGEARAMKRNLMVTVSDEHLAAPHRLTQEDLGTSAWLHRDYVVDNWPNSSDSNGVIQFNEERVNELKWAKNISQGKLGILQMQTNINPWQTLKGGLSSIKRLAGFSNYAIPEAIRHWHKVNDFAPNIILQDFIGHYNSDEIVALVLALNTANMTEDEVEKLFPEMGLDIVIARHHLNIHD